MFELLKAREKWHEHLTEGFGHAEAGAIIIIIITLLTLKGNYERKLVSELLRPYDDR